jgi:hypothetical protein
MVCAFKIGRVVIAWVLPASMRGRAMSAGMMGDQSDGKQTTIRNDLM